MSGSFVPRDGEMTLDEFRARGKELVDWVADFYGGIEDLRVEPDVVPGELRARIAPVPPAAPEAFDRIVADLDEIVVPGLTNWQSPNWFGFFPGNTSFAAILADLVAAGLGQQGMLWASSPISTELETAMVDWLVDALGLPQTWKSTSTGGGVIMGTASEATHLAAVVARESRPEPSLDELVAYGSEQAHSSIEKGARIAGYRHIRAVPVDEVHAMRPDALRVAIERDISAGLAPTFVCSTVGTTATTAVDPVRAIAEIARAHGVFHHVDAAYAGTAMICPEFRHLQPGLDLVDSYVFNPHKWMGANVDCTVFYVADRAGLIDAMSITPAYLRNAATESGEVIDYRDWHVALGRRFRSLKLWFVLRSYGVEGIRQMVRDHVRMARELTAWLDADDRFAVVAPTVLGLVSFRLVAGDDATERLAATINGTGRAYVTASRIDGVAFVRVAIGQTNTQQRHVDAIRDLIDDLA